MFLQWMVLKDVPEINSWLIKGMSNICLKVTKLAFSKLWFSKFKKFVSRSVFLELHFTQFFKNVCFISMHSVLNKNSEYIFFYITKSIILHAFLLVFKIVERLQCILKLCIHFSCDKHGVPTLWFYEWKETVISTTDEKNSHLWIKVTTQNLKTH